MRTEYDKDGMVAFVEAVEKLEREPNTHEVAICWKQSIKLLKETPLSVADNEAINHYRKKNKEAVVEDLNRFVKENNLFVYFDKDNRELRIKKVLLGGEWSKGYLAKDDSRFEIDINRILK